ncbi:hypothetical protein HID58_059865 [Brassica napus]|uniref:Uncharacterized protein n=1 Tax=Brassica napus TaxID=3708 RepID=A0ABQ7ZU47_BRANA|nr:hypothetical protein HID58_059865 [Brassica napus]
MGGPIVSTFANAFILLSFEVTEAMKIRPQENHATHSITHKGSLDQTHIVNLHLHYTTQFNNKYVSTQRQCHDILRHIGLGVCVGYAWKEVKNSNKFLDDYMSAVPLLKQERKIIVKLVMAFTSRTEEPLSSFCA